MESYIDGEQYYPNTEGPSITSIIVNIKLNVQNILFWGEGGQLNIYLFRTLLALFLKIIFMTNYPFVIFLLLLCVYNVFFIRILS